MKHIKLLEDLVAMSDPTYSNDVFKIRYKGLNTLSNKAPSDTIDKPVNDVLDGIEEGDVVTGISLADNKEHTGNVVRLQKDEKGENSTIEIEEDGEVMELAPSSVKFAEGGNKGNRSGAGTKGEPTDTGNSDYTGGSFDTFQPTTYESDKSLKNIKKFSDF